MADPESHNFPECFKPIEHSGPIDNVVSTCTMTPYFQSHSSSIPPNISTSQNTSANGYCENCNTTHSLSSQHAHFQCHCLMDILASEKRIDYEAYNPEPHFSTDYLFGPARGQMFGILVCKDSEETIGVLKAFSGQYDGIWRVNGWVPPLFDTEEMSSLCDSVEREIKNIGEEINQLSPSSPRVKILKDTRKKLSQSLMRKIHRLYTLHNFKGERAALVDVFKGKSKGIPTGAGDCCAPKLLNYAARHNLKPIGLAEFFWGKDNKSGTKSHQLFYSACQEKCFPLLGFMLCGLEHGQDANHSF